MRDQAKGAAALDTVGAHGEVVELDLTSLDSVRAGAAAVLDRQPQLDLLVNNAGVMATPRAAPPTGSSCSSAPTTSGTSSFTALLAPRCATTRGS